MTDKNMGQNLFGAIKYVTSYLSTTYQNVPGSSLSGTFKYQDKLFFFSYPITSCYIADRYHRPNTGPKKCSLTLYLHLCCLVFMTFFWPNLFNGVLQFDYNFLKMVFLLAFVLLDAQICFPSIQISSLHFNLFWFSISLCCFCLRLNEHAA